jgi:hypothetical protein
LSDVKKKPDGASPPGFFDDTKIFAAGKPAHGAPHPFSADISMLGSLAAGAPCVLPQGRTT